MTLFALKRLPDQSADRLRSVRQAILLSAPSVDRLHQRGLDDQLKALRFQFVRHVGKLTSLHTLRKLSAEAAGVKRQSFWLFAACVAAGLVCGYLIAGWL